MAGWTYVPCSGPTGGACARLRQWEHDLKLLDPGGRSLGIYNPRRVAGSRTWSLHACGRALDWAPSSREMGDRLIAWLLPPAHAGDVQLVIWQRRQWGGRAGPGWRPYGGADPHTGHFHFESRRCTPR